MGDKRDFGIQIIALVMGLWKRADREFDKKSARKAFRDTCFSILRGDPIEVSEPKDDTEHDSAEWARYVAYCDYAGMGDIVRSITEASMKPIFYGEGDDSDSDSETIEGFFPCKIKRRRGRICNPETDRRLKANKTSSQIDQMNRNLESARAKAREVKEAIRNWEEPSHHEGVNQSLSNEHIETIISQSPEDSSDIEYMAKRQRNSRPIKVDLPPLPMDYRVENEWIKNNIKSPDMLYSYVRKKSGDGIRWSSGLRKYYESNDFWEFAFDTLSSGGWNDSEHNRPIYNVAKYITKVIIEEYNRHEATKHSRFEGRFTTGKDLKEYVEVHCKGINKELLTEEYCEWFLEKMNSIGWRWNNGSTINNIPAQMANMYEDFKSWSAQNARDLQGLNPSQYGDTARIHKAIEEGKWKPRSNGKFSALDLKGLL